MQMLGFEDPSETADGGVGLAGILHSLRRRWLMVCLLGLPLAAGATFAAWRFTETEYIARAILQFNDTFNPIQTERGGQTVNPKGLNDRATQRQLITGTDVLNHAVDLPGIGELSVLKDVQDRAIWLEERVNATFPGNSDVLFVTVRCTNENAAKMLTDAVVKAYLDDVMRNVTFAKQQQLSELVDLQGKLETEINDNQRELKEMGFDENSVGGLNLEEKRQLADWNAITDRIREIDGLIRRAEAAQQSQSADGDPVDAAVSDGVGISDGADVVAEADASPVDAGTAGTEVGAETIAADQTGPPVFVSDVELSLAANEDGVVKRYKLAIEGLRNQIDDARRLLDEERAQVYVEQYEAQIQEYQQRIEERKTEIHDAIVLRKQLEQGGDSAGMDLPQLQALKQQLETELDDLERTMPNRKNLSPAEMFRVPLIQDEIAAARALLQETKERIREFKLLVKRNEERASQKDTKIPPEITVRDWARITPGEAERRRMMKCGALGFLSLLGWAGLVVGWDFRRQRVNSPIEVTKTLQLRVLGVVPLLKHRKRRNARQSERFAEAVDGISAALLCGTTGDDHRILLISSAMAGEGKTTLAANLASSLANAGRKTLLLDFDLRRPMLHRVYDIDVDPGISEVLVGESTPEEAIHDLDDPNLKLLTAGRWRQRSLSHLTDQNVARLFEDLRGRFDFIVVDASPILPAVDTRIVARHVDGVVLSMLRDVSETPKVKAACEVLNSFNVNILGAVVIGASADLYYGYPLSSSRKRA